MARSASAQRARQATMSSAAIEGCLRQQPQGSRGYCRRRSSPRMRRRLVRRRATRDLRELLSTGTKTDQKHARNFCGLPCSIETRAAPRRRLGRVLPRRQRRGKRKSLMTKARRAGAARSCSIGASRLSRDFLSLSQELKALMLIDATMALYGSRAPCCSATRLRASAAGALDFEDLILKTPSFSRRPWRSAMGALQARRRPRPHPGRRGAGHEPRAVADRFEPGARILLRPRRQRRRARCSRSATRSSRSIGSRARRRRCSPRWASASRRWR